MRHARIAWRGAVRPATVEDDGTLRLADGRAVPPAEVVWLPPVRIGTAFALGLNYADHAAELAFKAPEVPLVFLKGPNTFIGHRATTRRPDGVRSMHYECELAVVIGRGGRGIRRERAYEHVAGYTVANDYAIRDYLETLDWDKTPPAPVLPQSVVTETRNRYIDIFRRITGRDPELLA